MTIFVNLLDIIGLSVAGLILLLFASLFVYLEIKKRIENKQNKYMETDIPNLSNSENIGKNLKPFDLQAARSGKPVCTRDGKKARILCFDRIASTPIVALVKTRDTLEKVYQYYNNGRCYNSNGRIKNDLVMDDVKYEGWINIYYDIDNPFYSGIFKTKEEAERFYQQHDSDIDKTKVRTIKVEWEE